LSAILDLPKAFMPRAQTSVIIFTLWSYSSTERQSQVNRLVIIELIKTCWTIGNNKHRMDYQSPFECLPFHTIIKTFLNCTLYLKIIRIMQVVLFSLEFNMQSRWVVTRGRGIMLTSNLLTAAYT
jgi:hypothetical protein